MHTISISKFILLIYNNKEKILKTPKKEGRRGDNGIK